MFLGYLKQVMPISLFSFTATFTYWADNLSACRYLGIRYCFGVRTSLSAKLMFSEYFDSNIEFY